MSSGLPNINSDGSCRNASTSTVRCRSCFTNQSQLHIARRHLGQPFQRVRHVCNAKDWSDEELMKLIGEDTYKEAMQDEEEHEGIELPMQDLPQRPKYLSIKPKKGTRYARYYRETTGFKKKDKHKIDVPHLMGKPLPQIDKSLVVHDRPMPWQPKSHDPPPPLISFPQKRPPFVEYREFVWERGDYFDQFYGLYPVDQVKVEVTITNDPNVADEWASARLDEACMLYGIETKWWTSSDTGEYYSDTFPGRWSDLALLQIATTNHVLLVQPLEMPVEAFGEKIRYILKYKYIKKAGYYMLAKTHALKMCELAFHGAHDMLTVLKRTLGIPSIKLLPEKVQQQDITVMSKFFLGMDLEPEKVIEAKWEKEHLTEEMIEIAAKEAWCAQALYIILAKMTMPMVELWDSLIPNLYSLDEIQEKKDIREDLVKGKAVVLKHVQESIEKREERRKTSKLAKSAAAELITDAGVDLYEAVDKEILGSSY